MKKKQQFGWTAATFMTLTLFACVTINIYFPAEKVESAAGEIVKDIRHQEQNTPQEGGDQSDAHQSFFQEVRKFISPAAAWASDATTVSNPTIRALKEKMKERFQQLKPYYEKGVLEEGDNGYLEIADAGGLNLKEKRDLKALVEAENSDRKTLYEEVAKALGIDPGQIDKVAEIFAKEWQKPVE